MPGRIDREGWARKMSETAGGKVRNTLPEGTGKARKEPSGNHRARDNEAKIIETAAFSIIMHPKPRPQPLPLQQSFDFEEQMMRADPKFMD